MKVLVVGGAGFIGAAVARELEQRGHRPVVFDDFSTGARQRLRGRPHVEGSLRRPEDLRRVLSNHGFEGGVFLAGVCELDAEPPERAGDPHARWTHHLEGWLDFLRLWRDYGNAPLVLASTLEVYPAMPGAALGGPGGPVPAPESATGRIAWALEQILADACGASSLRASVVRLPWVSGADLDADLGEDRPQPAHWLARVLSGLRFELRDGASRPWLLAPRSPAPRRDPPEPEPEIELLHIADAAAALLGALERVWEGRGGVFDLGTGKPQPLGAILAELDGRLGDMVPVPGWPAPQRRRVDVAALERSLGFAPRRSALASIVGDALQWRLRCPDGYRSLDQARAWEEGMQAERVGELALRLGYVTPQGLLRALARQQELVESGQGHRLLGLVMLKEGLLSNEQLIEVLRRYENQTTAY